MPMATTLPKFLFHFVKRYKWSFAGLFIIAIYWAANVSLTPYAMKLLIDAVAEANDGPTLVANATFPALLYISLGLILSLLFRLNDYISLKTFPKLKADIVEEMHNYVEQHSYSYFQNNFAGSLGNKINDMARSGALILISLYYLFFARSVALIIGIITLYLVNPHFAYILLFWSLVFISTSLYLSKRAAKYTEILSESRSTLTGKIVDSLSNILTIKSFAREPYERAYLKPFVDDAAKKDQTSQFYFLKIKLLYSFSFTFLTASMIYLLIYEKLHNRVTIGDFALILTLNIFLIEELFFFANELVPFSENVGACNQALSIITPHHEIVDDPDALVLNVTKGEIRFENVHFKYKKGQSLFSDKSIVIHPGEKVGLVGTSGAGKSTFVNLILRFFDIESGKILIDGQDIKKVTQHSLRSQIGMIPQDPLLFHRTIEENIAYGRPAASQEEIIACSKKAHCHEFIESLPQGYKSLVGERGIKLSGGQRQRIAIARALLKNAPILILDEATSSLDSITENFIQESLLKLMENKTTIVIAHRLSTLYQMDRLLIFSDGKIVEDGTHDSLIKANGHYARLWNMQAGGFIV